MQPIQPDTEANPPDREGDWCRGTEVEVCSIGLQGGVRKRGLKASLHGCQSWPTAVSSFLPGYRCAPLDYRAGWCQHFLWEGGKGRSRGRCWCEHPSLRRVSAGNRGSVRLHLLPEGPQRVLWQPEAQLWGRLGQDSQGLGAGGRLCSFTTHRLVASGGSWSLLER